MLDISLDMKPPTPEERALILRRHLSKGGVFFDYDRLLEYYAHFKIEEHFIAETLVRLTNCTDDKYTKTSFKRWCTSLGIFKGFKLTPKEGISFDEDSLKAFIEMNAYGTVDVVPGVSVTKVVEIFKEFCYNVNQALLLWKIIDQHPPINVESSDGRRMCVLTPDVVLQNTGRVGYHNPAIQNLPRYMHDLIVAPKGWILLAADSSQIEPKTIFGFFMPDPQILKLIEVEGDAYYAQLHYSLMDQSEIDTMNMNFTKTDITPELLAMRAKLKTYGNGVMYGSTSNIDKDPTKDAYIERIGKHALRLKWVESLQKRLDSGQTIFETVFGTPIDIYKSDKYVKATTEQDRRRVLLNCAINNPIQGTAADLMAFSLKATDELFRKKAPNSWIVAFKHDEGIYCIHEDDYDAVIDEVRGHTSYNIVGKVKIYNDPIEGRTISKYAPCSYRHLECDANG